MENSSFFSTIGHITIAIFQMGLQIHMSEHSMSIFSKSVVISRLFHNPGTHFFFKMSKNCESIKGNKKFPFHLLSCELYEMR